MQFLLENSERMSDFGRFGFRFLKKTDFEPNFGFLHSPNFN